MVCQSAMFTASFEGMYSAFSRMHVQRTWDGIINAPIALDDVVVDQRDGRLSHAARQLRQ
jgi:lipooligosaccharide transport system permease protein